MLRSATGRAYIAFCSETERNAVLQRLRHSVEPGNFLAKNPALVQRLLEETRRLGYGHRMADFGGHFEKSRREWDDERDSIALPIWAGDDVVAVVNLTWMHRVATVAQMVKAHLGQLTEAAREIAAKLASP
jgi:IclR family mhp operon transcriptional activator